MKATTLTQLSKEMKKIVKNFDAQAERILKREASFFVSYAKKLTTRKKVVNIGYYRNSFAYAREVKKSGIKHSIEVYNSADYAIYLEYGFRAHFVPGYWRGNVFVYQRGYKGGMFVGKKGSVVRGHYIMKETEQEQKKSYEKRIGEQIEQLFRVN